jgi:peptidoglycan/LPS O-acetylase OafA/YrhL
MNFKASRPLLVVSANEAHSVIRIPPNQRYAFVDYLKVIATFTVVIAHKFEAERDWIFSEGVFQSEFFDPVQYFLTTGGGGVILFFMISGFLITKATMRETVRQFLVRRAMRILPLYWLAIIILLISGRLKLVATETAGSFSLLGDFWNSKLVLGGVDWTLRLEILFYIFAATILYCLVNQTKKFWGRALLAFLPIILLVIPNYPNGWTLGYPAIFLPMFIPGVAVAIYDFNRNRLFLFIGILSAYIISYFNMFRYRSDLRDQGYITYSVIALFIFIVAFSLKERIPEIRSVKLIANISYPIYLSHLYLLDDFNTMINWLKESFNSELISFVLEFQLSQISVQKMFALVLTLGSCWVVSVLIEQPCIKVSRRWSNRFQKRLA